MAPVENAHFNIGVNLKQDRSNSRLTSTSHHAHSIRGTLFLLFGMLDVI